MTRYEMAKKFLEALSQEKSPIICFQPIHDSERSKDPAKRAKSFHARLNKATWQKLESYQERGFGIYVSLNEIPKGKERKNTNVKDVRAFFFDCDAPKWPGPSTEELYERYGPPTIHTGRDENHRHYIYVLSERSDIETFYGIQLALAEKYNSDPSVTDLVRVIRLPGTYNLKEPKKKELHKLHTVNDNLYTKDDILGTFKVKPAKKKTPERKTEGKLKESLPGARKRFLELLRAAPDIDGEGERNNEVYKLACEGANLGVSERDRLKTLRSFNEHKVDPPLDSEELEAINANASEYNQNGEGSEHPALDFVDVDSAKNFLGDILDPDTAFDEVNEERATGSDDEDDEDDEDEDLLAEMWRTPFADFAYVVNSNCYFRLSTLEDYAEAQFNNMSYHLMKKKSERPAQYCLRHKLIKIYERAVYEPGEDAELKGDNFPRLNLWKDTKIKPVEGGIDWFHEHVEYLIPNKVERRHFYDWCGHVIKNPGDKIHYSLVLQGVEGTGKSFFKRLFREILGSGNVANPSNENLLSNFNGYLKKCQLVCVDELMVSGGFVMNKLKGLITEDTVNIEDKGRNLYEQRNCFSFFCTTNHRKMIRINRNDRRWLVIYSKADPKDPEYYVTLFENMAEKAANVAYYFQNDYEFSKDFWPKGPAPSTEAKKVLIETSKDEIEEWLDSVMDNKEGLFASDMINLNEVLSDPDTPDYVKRAPKIGKRLVDMLDERGAEKMASPKRVGKRGKVRLWIIRNVKKWVGAGETEIGLHFEEVFSGDGAAANKSAADDFDEIPDE